MRSFAEYMNAKGKVEKPIVEPKVTNPDDVVQPEPAMKSGKAMKKKAKLEYINGSGKLVEKPEVKAVADYDGPYVKSPEGKDAAPYKAANDDVKSPTFSVEKSGLGELGDNKLKYQPNTEYKQEVVKTQWTKTESFLNKTKSMNLAEFTKYMLGECGCGGEMESSDLPYVTAYTAGKFQPHPPEAIKYVVVLANKNDNILDNVVREMKTSGCLGKLIKTILDHPESYDELTALFGDDEDGSSRCKMFARSMNNSLEKFTQDYDSMYESVSSPVGFEDETDEEDYDMEDDEENKEEDEDLDMGDDDYDMEDEDMDDEEDMGDEDMEDEDMGDEDMEDHEHIEDHPRDHEEDLDNIKELNPKRKLKKKFAHHNLLNAMKGFDSIKNSLE